MKFVLVIFIVLFVQKSNAAELNVKGGDIRTFNVPVDCKSCMFGAKVKILKLNDTDPKWAASTGLVLHGAKKERATIGLVYFGEKRGLTSIVNSFNELGEPTTLKTIKSNLKYNVEYEIDIFWGENRNVLFKVTGVESIFDIGFKPIRAEFIVSGMQLEFVSK